MNLSIKSLPVLALTALFIASCASDPAPVQKRDPYNDADSQRSRAGQSQGEMSRDTSK